MMLPVGSNTASEVVGPILEIRNGPTRLVVRPGQTVVIGRGRSCELVVPDKSVSRRHARVEHTGEAWVVRDLGSRNGIHRDGHRSTTITITDGSEVRIGSPYDGPILTFAVRATAPAPASTPEAPPSTDADPSSTVGVPAPRQPASVTRTSSLSTPPAVVGRREIASFDADGRITIGRSDACDITLKDDLLVSRRHAEIRRVGSDHQLIDLGSTNGTYLNGTQVDKAWLRPGDLIAVGRYEFAFDGHRLREYVDTGPVSLSAERITVDIGKKRILSDVSFSLSQGSLLGVVGPSGCGKSTLIRAVTGLRPATHGRVNYDGRDLYAEYAELRYRIGMVPQDDVLHRQLTVRRALRFAASLRFADDVPRRERAARVEEVLKTLGLTEQASQRIDLLSGGQRKRTSVALELLTEPSLLCLDEPTSGLDPALDKEVMQELREMADRGRTVLCVTHSVLHLNLCHRVLVLCRGGTTGYFGPPEQLLDFFEAEDYADVFAKVTHEPEYWTKRYRESDLYRRYVAEPIAAHYTRLAASPVPPPLPTSPADDTDTGSFSFQLPAPIAGALNLGGRSMAARAKHPVAPLRHFATLCLRMFAVIGADRGYLLFLLGLPLVLALLSHAVPGETGLGPPVGGFSLEAQRLLVVLVVGAAFIGIASSIREIVNEAPIYKRERAVGLSPGAYLTSKFTVLGLINVVQVTVFVYFSLLGRGAPAQALVLGSPLLEIIVPVAMVAASCTMMGLCISALARTVAQTTPVLVVVVMAQLVLSGGLFELAGETVLNVVSWISPTRWGFAAGASTVDLRSMLRVIDDPLWTASTGAWWRSILLLLAQILLLALAARLAMRRLEPGR